jgi:hypothetical protein
MIMNKSEIKNAIVAEKKRHADAMKYLESKLRSIEYDERVNRSKAYEKKKELLDETGKWLQDKLKVGDWIQVTESRAGKWREVLAITNGVVIGAVLNFRRVRTPEGVKVNLEKSLSHVTEQGMNKITHVYRDGKFVAVKDLMKVIVDITT